MLAPSSDPAKSSNLWSRAPAMTAALIVAIVSTAAIAGAWFFELVLKLRPCPLCLEQRVPYYIAIPLAVVVAIAAARRAPRAVLVGGLLILAALMVWSGGLGVFHAGVEWKFWPGPTECSGAGQFGPAEDLMKRLQNVTIVRCDEAAWRLFGLSLAGYNVLIAGALAVVAVLGALKTRRAA